VSISLRRALEFVWQDPRGGRCVQAYTALTPGAASLTAAETDLAAAITLLSGASLVGVWERRWIGFGDPGEPTPYGRVEDRLLLTGLSTNKHGVRLIVPAPIPDVLDSGGIKVVMTHPGIVALTDAAKLAIADFDGAAPESFKRGTRCVAELGHRG